MSAAESFVDVLVIGAGPAGLMCANALAHAGVNVRVVDKRPAKVAAGQADGIQPRTIEVLQSYGLADRLIREGNQMHVAAFYNPNEKGEIECTGRAPDVTAPTARFPFEITLHQGAIESIFLDSMRERGVTVERPIVPSALVFDELKLSDPSAYAVKVTLQHLETEESPSREEIVNAKFVVGADGAHSWVRKTLDISMDGEQTDYIWGVVDMVPDTNFPDIRNRTAIHSVNGSCMVIPREGDKVRLYIQLADRDVLDPATGRVDRERMSPEKLMAVARKTFLPYVLKDPQGFDWWTIYIIGQRVASKFSVHERVFIAGDACHTHSPKAGQGMNASMNDTHNLAWKITHVLRGWADMALLKTYELERRKYAQDLIDFDKKFSALFSGKPRTDAVQDGVTHEQFLSAFQIFGGFTSGIGVHYAPSPLVDARHQACAVAAAHLVVGQRMPPHVFVRAADSRPVDIQDMIPADARFKVLVFAGRVGAHEPTAPAPARLERLRAVAGALEGPGSFLRRWSGEAFDVITITAGTNGRAVNLFDLPEVLRSHWSKVLTDDMDVTRTRGGGAYERFGIDPDEVTLVIVRPDGYVGMVAPASRIEDVNAYFAGFMRTAVSTWLGRVYPDDCAASALSIGTLLGPLAPLSDGSLLTAAPAVDLAIVLFFNEAVAGLAEEEVPLDLTFAAAAAASTPAALLVAAFALFSFSARSLVVVTAPAPTLAFIDIAGAASLVLAFALSFSFSAAGAGAGAGAVFLSPDETALFTRGTGTANDISRAEDLSTKLRTLTYDHERLTSMHRSAKEQAANAEREMNVHKSRLATTTRTLHTAESAHKHTTAELQRTRTSIQALRASHTSELKKKERDVERMTEKWTKLAEAQSKLSASSAASGMTIRGANADVVTGSEVLWQGRTVDEEALEQAEQARAQLYEENGRLRRLVISSANELQRVVWSARSLTCDAEEEPQPLTSVELFPIAPVGAANDRFAAMFTTLEDTLAYLPERLANGELATRSMKASKSGEEQLLPKANLEAERLQGVIDSLQAELDETRKLHQAQAAETQELYEQLSAQQVQHDGDINAGADEAREDLAGLRVQIEEERRKLAKEKAAFETDRIRLRDEKRSFQADQMLSPPPQPAPVLAPAASTSRRHAPVPKPALASPHAKSPPRKSKPPAIAVGVAKAKAKPGLGARGSKRTVGRRSSAAFNAHANASISSRHEPAYETEVIPETISAAALAGADGVSAGAGALGLGAPAFELPKRRESILPTSFVLPPPSPRTSLPPANSIPFSLLPPETPLAGYGDEDDEGTTPSTVGPVPAPGATDSDGDGYTPPSAPQVQVTAAPEPDPAPSALAPPAQTPARPFPRARTLAPHMTHAYSPAKPSPLSRILMLARDSPESPEETQKQVLAASRAMGLAAGGAGQHACAEGERSPEGISTPIVLPRLGGGHAGEREEESPLREKRAEANVVAVPG
ncbi:hypothetical protein CONPUDRAFT_147281 [Coniophora puteana RWD-64-598 SS2]|uniref:FAD-binding domain-containing protein n=1 Tax=Coniophora puteana (strain RWD-64-598) TaxID=741705 RepID=A0A5M3M7S9_CONPW|nr:uncharacterized protein CONPUDRAFT_147281 [Coniophora puteana RWD-64-598 SS2]EIW75097.1 hypothetical protein CONPUDRAFT_147281 [Coniophora puteana RWD-64-598 SS2]